MKLVVLTIIILAVSFILLGIKVLFVKGAKFPSAHASHSASLRSKGIGCASQTYNKNKA